MDINHNLLHLLMLLSIIFAVCFVEIFEFFLIVSAVRLRFLFSIFSHLGKAIQTPKHKKHSENRALRIRVLILNYK